MKRAKRFLALLLVLVMTGALLTACGGAKEQAQDAAETVEEEAAPAAEEAADEAAEAAEEAAPAAEEAGEAEEAAPAASGEPRTVEEREDALPGNRVVPDSYTADDFPGLDEIGVAPKKKFFIAYANGEDSSDWCRAIEDDMLSTAKKYEEEYGIKFEYTSAGNDVTKQLSDIQSLIAMKPDMLIIMPNEAEPLAVVKDWCDEAGIPLMVINNEINATPGEGSYVCQIGADYYLNGIWHALALVHALEEKNGAPKGDIAELAGILGASPAILRAQAARYVFNQYPDINIVISRPGEWDATTSYSAAQDIFTVYPDGQLDGFIGGFDDGAIVVSDLVKETGRTDIGNRITGNDGSLAAMKAIRDGKMLVAPETSPYYATFAFEYAMHYLNGEEIPSYVQNPQRIFMADTPEKAAALDEIIKYCEDNGLSFAPSSIGYYDVFPAYTDEIKAIYPTPYNELDSSDTTFFPEPWTETESTIR